MQLSNANMFCRVYSVGFFILKELHLGFSKNALPPLEPKLLVMLGRIVKRCTLFSANSIGAGECAAYHGMALEPFSANW
jgi:hypothetical protein